MILKYKKILKWQENIDYLDYLINGEIRLFILKNRIEK
jgi:hypothetical protein